jgi:NADH dehydrogenase
MTQRISTVFGGAGFIGRHVVRRLAQRGDVVRIAGRDTVRAAELKPLGAVGQIVPLAASLTDAPAVARAVAGATDVVNLVGILAEGRPGDFDRVQHQGAAEVARQSAAAGVVRLVHVSAIGADPDSPSAYARSKGRGEIAVRAGFPAATILRPSIVVGEGDGFLCRFGQMARISPVLPVISPGTRFQPVAVNDVADAILAALTRADAAGKTYELGGPEVRTFRELLAMISAETRRDRPVIEVPGPIARLQAAVLERLPGKMLTRDQLLLLAKDNVVAQGALTLADLGITATPLSVIAPQVLARFRPHARRAG